MRQNRVSWFKGRIRQIRITPGALPASELLHAGSAAPPHAIPLWPEGVPGAKPDGGEERLEDGRVYNVQQPSLTYVPPDPGTGNGTAVIVCPGGSYARLATANEGDGAARMLRQPGVSTFILKYRLAEYGFPAPLQDVLRAIRLVRSRGAAEGRSRERDVPQPDHVRGPSGSLDPQGRR